MPYKNCKIVLCGLGGVGKTTIAQALAGTLKLNEDRKMTPGIDFHHLEIAEDLIRIQLWDLGGQDQFRTFQECFFESAHVVILVFSVLRFPSFLNIEEWIPLIKQDNLIKTYLIGNKIDDTPRVVNKEEAIKIASDYKMNYFEISAVKGLGFEEFRTDLVTTIKSAFADVDLQNKVFDISYQSGKDLSE